jgi:NAD(P)-dependent dehydrogenase (short-subunit alcohol dehydrogenase family)
MPEPEGPVALVTAASRGMGAACASELASCGCEVVVMSRSDDLDALASEIGAVAVRGSVDDASDIERLVNAAIQRFGRIDAVVNNTGHPAKGELLEFPDAVWMAGFELVVMNVIRMARLVTPVMIHGGGGAIVNISSFGAVEPALAYPISSALRGALANFTKLYSDRYAPDGIRMNSILPGFIDSHEVDESIQRRIPMQRAGTVEEIATTAAFLLSDSAGYITGQSIRVDGGWTRSV